MYTANTMATAIEALGMSLPYSSSMPAGTSKASKLSFCTSKASKLSLRRSACRSRTPAQCPQVLSLLDLLVQKYLLY